jgi:tetratricopeptide (TPR) repeat protein/triacylglycerol esterase/lipase EstA (alpha/beta hydrolase family)
MGPSTGQPITFIVTGLEQAGTSAGATRGAAPVALPAALPRGRIKQSVRVGARRGGGLDRIRMSAVPGDDIVVLHIAGGPSLVLHPENARDLLLAQGDVARGENPDGSAAPAPAEIEVAAQLRWHGLAADAATRGAGDLMLAGIDVITGLVKDPAADLVASGVVAAVDGQVNPGVYALRRDSLPNLKDSGAALAKLPEVAPGEPLLVLVHGTFSSTPGTFGKLWTEHPQQVAALFARYNDRVYGLDHPTLGASPIGNALALARTLPKGARLHLLTHSRGGLVAEAMARVCGDPDRAAANPGAFGGGDQQRDRDDLAALAALVKQQAIRVDRVVRVACPARGTLLASKRLDAYLSVLKWGLELAGVPVIPALVDFLSEVALRRSDPTQVPGLAAMIPDSPLIRWLHATDVAVHGDLRVVAGDIRGDSVTSWVKTLLADAFFWTDNDLVVQTSSMYGGAPRPDGASFVLDQGSKVSHFSYFANEGTAAAIVNALVQDTAPQGFRRIGPLSWAGQSSGGVRAAPPFATNGAAVSDKPAVIVLPGMLGSNLKVNGARVWLSWRLGDGLARLKYEPDGRDGVQPDGPIAGVYDGLAQFLAGTHEVIELACDWRRPIEEQASDLARPVEAALAARERSGQPVRILAHSTGGLVARTMQLERPDVWQRLMSRAGARLLMLGTPNGGSWTPMQVLSGDDTFGNTLALLGAPFQGRAVRQLMAELPGFIQLQAGLLDQTLALDRHETWQKLADDDLARIRAHGWWHGSDPQIDALAWGVPPQAVLDRAVNLRRRLDAQVQQDPIKLPDNVLLVVGRAPFTAEGFATGQDGLVYLGGADVGDGRVTLASARLPGVRTWQLDCEHGRLPEMTKAFDSYLQLLNDGTVTGGILEPLTESPVARAAAAPPARVRSRPSHNPPASEPPKTTAEVLAPAVADRDERRPLEVTVVNSDIRFIAQPIMIGHYRSTVLGGTEEVVDRLIGGAMTSSLKAGLYPDSPGDHQIFVNTGPNRDNPFQLPRPKAAIVIGLGPEGELRQQDLERTVRQAVIAWAQRMAEMPPRSAAELELAASLIGSGGSGISAGQAALLIAQGVRAANERLQSCGWPQVGRLFLVELYLDRAIEAWRTLQVQATAAPGRYAISGTVQPGAGALPRLRDAGYRGADYDFISALTGQHSGETSIAYTLDTRRARSEVRAQALQGRLVRELVARAADDRNVDEQIGRTLFQLLVPVELEPFLGGTTEMQIELDRGTAGIPWELIDTQANGDDARPWAIRAKLLRKLLTVDFRSQVIDTNLDASVLVIGEPECDSRVYPRLPGARNEANAVYARLTAPGALPADKVKKISPEDPEKPGADALTIFGALGERDWRIVHIAGHGQPPRGNEPGGVVLSNGTFLGPQEVGTLRVVPELVFVNCCHLGVRGPDQPLRSDPPGRSFNRAQFASGVAGKLIEIGVRCVIAAGWAVDDAAAQSFATTFYDALLRGHRFLDAVAQAREAAWKLRGNTWGAYQCYGDPNWRFRRKGGDAQRPTPVPGDEFSGIATAQSLVLALQTLAVESKYQRAPKETQVAKIGNLETRFAAIWGGSGEVADAYGAAWAEAGERDAAIRWYDRALAANDGGASIKAAEQLGNLRVRVAWEKVDAAVKQYDAVRQSGPGPGDDRAAVARARAGLEQQIKAADVLVGTTAREALSEIRGGIALLEQILGLEPSMERHSLCGSAYKRQAMAAEASRQRRLEKQAIEQMRLHYGKSEQLGRAGQLAEVFYPILNYIAADLVINRGDPGWGLDAALVAAARQSLDAKAREDPDFWSVIGQTELTLYEALASGTLVRQRPDIEVQYRDLHGRVDAVTTWASVYDQMRFVVPRCRIPAGAELDAAMALQRLVESFAFPERRSAPPERRSAPPERRSAPPERARPPSRRASRRRAAPDAPAPS